MRAFGQVVESLKFLTPLAFDVMTYVIIGHLASPRSMLKEDGTSFSHWLASLAKFTGQLYQKFPGIELSGLLQVWRAGRCGAQRARRASPPRHAAARCAVRDEPAEGE